MGWRIVSVSSRAKLDYRMDYLVVRTAEKTVRIHLSEISVLVIESLMVSLTSFLINELEKRKICTIFCDERHCPQSLLVSLAGSYDASAKLRSQINWSTSVKERVWAAIIQRKILGQRKVLLMCNKEKADSLFEYAMAVTPGDKTNREGHAAKVYFHSLFGEGFTRDDSTPVNLMLNYGYSILLAATAREIAASGYSTQIGVFHDNAFNHFNLASDLMEPFRLFWDYTINSLTADSLGKDEKAALINVLNQKIIIKDKVHYLNNALRIYVKSVLDSLDENKPERIIFPEYELSIHETNDIL